MAEIWESIAYSAEDVRDLGDRLFLVLRQRFRGRGSGVDVESRVGCVFELRAEVLIEMRSYPDVADALAAAGLES
jgi:hypothetical protein